MLYNQEAFPFDCGCCCWFCPKAPLGLPKVPLDALFPGNVPFIGEEPKLGIMDARKGLGPPVICGRRPCPKAEPPPKPPDGCDPSSLPAPAGVAGAEPGMGGKDSINEAPNEDDGLNAFSPEKPVIWGFKLWNCVPVCCCDMPVGWEDIPVC